MGKNEDELLGQVIEDEQVDGLENDVHRKIHVLFSALGSAGGKLQNGNLISPVAAIGRAVGPALVVYGRTVKHQQLGLAMSSGGLLAQMQIHRTAHGGLDLSHELDV